MLAGLDISKSATGWAVIDGSTCHSGVWRCPIVKPEGLGVGKIDAVYTGMVADWLHGQIFALTKRFTLTHAAIEQPMPGNSKKRKPASFKGAGSFELSGADIAPEVSVGTTAFDVTHFLHGLVVIGARVFARQNIPAVYVASQTWRSTMQVGRPPKQDVVKGKLVNLSASQRRDWYKRRALEICRKRGIRVDSPDQAEAVLIALHLQTITERDRVDMFTPAKQLETPF